MKIRAIVGAAMAFALVASLSACKKEGTDSGTDAAPGTDAANTDAANTDAANTDAANTDAAAMGATLTAHVYDVINMTAGVAGVDVDLYAVADTTETTSLANGTTDATGDVDLALATIPAFVYAKVTPGVSDEVTFTYWNYPVTGDDMRNTPYFGATAWTIASNPSGTGLVSGAIVDCLGARVSGATVSVSPASGTVVYIDATTGLPGAGTMTDASGSYMVIGVTPGATSMDADTGTMVTGCTATTASTDVFVRADAPHVAVTAVP